MLIMVSYNDCGGGSSSGGEDSGGDPIGGEDSGGIEWDNTPGGGGPYIPDPEQVITEPLVCRGNCVENPWMSEFETQLNTANLLSCWNNFDTAQQGVVEEFIVSDYGSEASMDFALEGVSAICSNGEVDWKNKIIKDPSFIDTKAECVLDELISTGNNLFKETTDQFTENNSKFKLKFAVGTTTQGGSAQTSSPDNNGIVTITFNPNDLNANSLHIASTILHESIHAELKRIVATNNQGSNPLPTAYYNYLYQLHQYWTDNSAPNFVWSHTEHNYMATQHVIPIANSVRQFDENTHPLENYMEFAWSGLYLEGLLGNPPVVTEAQQTEYANLALIPLNDEHQSQCDE